MFVNQNNGFHFNNFVTTRNFSQKFALQAVVNDNVCNISLVKVNGQVDDTSTAKEDQSNTLINRGPFHMHYRLVC